MIAASRPRAAPLRFLIGTLLVWAVGRGLMLWGWRPPRPVLPHVIERPHILAPHPPARGGERAAATFIPLGAQRSRRAPEGIRHRHTPGRDSNPPSALRVAHGIGPSMPHIEDSLLTAPDAAPPAEPPPDGSPAPSVAPLPAPPLARPDAPGRLTHRLTGSAWMLARGGGGGVALASAGQIGGAQAGMRVVRSLGGGWGVAARLSRALDGPSQSEAALGLDWQPARRVPLHLLIDRRVRLARGGRDAWSLGVAGGVSALHPVRGWRIDGYAQAGLVGAHRRDPYADGALRLGREIALRGAGASVTIGGGLTGAAQPGAARLEAAPGVVLRAPVAGRTLSAALDMRMRLAGRARPGSGPALTLAVDF